jgi:hypothetical protein
MIIPLSFSPSVFRVLNFNLRYRILSKEDAAGTLVLISKYAHTAWGLCVIYMFSRRKSIFPASKKRIFLVDCRGKYAD